MRNIKVKAMRISSYHTTIDSAFRTPESAVPVYLNYGISGDSKPTLRYVPNANANKIAWHQGSIWDPANCLEAQRHPSTPLTSGSHVAKEEKILSSKQCLLQLQFRAINQTVVTS